MNARMLLACALLWIAAGPSVWAQDQEAPAPGAKAPRLAADRALDYLLASQNPDGSWGSHRNVALGMDESWTNPETHRSWTVAVTGLCCLALDPAHPEEQGGNAAACAAAWERGLRYLLKNAVLKRPSDWDLDNNWGYIYGLQALVNAYAFLGGSDEENARALREETAGVIRDVIERLARFRAVSNGWGYYDEESPTCRPQWSTSFMTAVALLALFDARDAGFAVDDSVVEGGLRALERCRLRSGAYTYSVEALPWHGGLENIDQVKGSLSRIQVCNLALFRAGRLVTQADLVQGLELFFREHKFLDIARKKPIPHEAYYYNSGYFYFFGHYYAACVIAALPRAERTAWWSRLQEEIMKTQEKDGSMWDYYMNSYGKPYGTAFSLLALRLSRR